MASDGEQRGAWVMRTTVGADEPAQWEQVWDPEATPMDQASQDGILRILFGPRASAPPPRSASIDGASLWDSTPKQRALDFVDLAASQIRDLLPYVTCEQTVEPPAVHAACIESFLVNVRLVIDFLIKGKPATDVLAKDFAPGWKPDEALRQRLLGYFALTSQHVVHLSRSRVPEDVGEIAPLEAESYRRMAADCAEALAAFQAARTDPSD